MSDVEVLLTVGKLDASLALLTTQDHHVIEFPTMLLPDNVKAGSIVKLSVSQNLEEEKRQLRLFKDIQTKILEKYGVEKPKAPVLKIVNVTQTSCVLAWDPLSLGSARLKSLILYRQGVRSMVIPSPLKTVMTKISGLSIDTDYEFQLKLSTTSGQYWSERVKMHTHKMTDMSGITVCLGSLDPSQNISGEQIAVSLQKVGARPMQKHTAIDTTHFVTNDTDNEDDQELLRAKSSNIPIVRPEWVRACEVERRIVGVRGFYLDADPGILKSYQFPKITSSKVKFTKEPETIAEERRGDQEEPKEKQNTQENKEDTKKDGKETKEDSTGVPDDVDLDKLKGTDEVATETTTEVKDDATQSEQNVSESHKNEGSLLTESSTNKAVENGVTSGSLESTASKPVEPKADEDAETLRSEETKNHQNVDEQQVEQANGKLVGVEEKQQEADQKQVEADEKQVDADEKKQEADKQQQEVDEKQLDADEKRVDVDQQQLDADEKQLDADKKQLDADKKQLDADEKQLDVDEKKHDADEKQLDASEERQAADEGQSDANEKQPDADEETLEVRSEESKNEKTEPSLGENVAPASQEGQDIKEENSVDKSPVDKEETVEVSEEVGQVEALTPEQPSEATQETADIVSEETKDKNGDSTQEKNEENVVPTSDPAPAPEQQPEEAETVPDGSMENGEEHPATEEEKLGAGPEGIQNENNDSNQTNGEQHEIPASEANVEQVNLEGQNGDNVAEIKPEETKNSEESRESSPEVKSDEARDTPSSEEINQEEVKSQSDNHTESPSPALDGVQGSESNAGGKEATHVSVNTHSKSTSSSKKHKKKNKNKKK